MVIAMLKLNYASPRSSDAAPIGQRAVQRLESDGGMTSHYSSEKLRQLEWKLADGMQDPSDGKPEHREHSEVQNRPVFAHPPAERYAALRRGSAR
jgi:hypothetical protein